MCCVELVKARSVLWKKCDECKQTGRHKEIQESTCKICQECVDAAESLNVEDSTDSVNVQKTYNKLVIGIG